MNQAKIQAMQGVYPVWQPQGHSTHIITKHISHMIGDKTSHTGTLDPMAEGVIIVLAGEERLKKYEYAKWTKKYTFQILFGVETDTGDALGLFDPQSAGVWKEGPALDSSTFKHFVGKYTQEVPIYSAIKHKGRPLHQHAKLQTQVNALPKRSGEIYTLKHVKTTLVNAKTLQKNIESRILNVSGDFRQDQIIYNWKSFFSTHKSLKKMTISDFQVEMTKGLYVRSLTQDICRFLGASGLTLSIIRTHNGKYDKKSSYSLNSLFGNKITEYSFKSYIGTNKKPTPKLS